MLKILILTLMVVSIYAAPSTTTPIPFTTPSSAYTTPQATQPPTSTATPRTTTTEENKPANAVKYDKKRPLSVLVERPSELVDLTHKDDKEEVIVGNMKPVPWMSSPKSESTSTTKQAPASVSTNPPSTSKPKVTETAPGRNPNGAPPGLAQKLTAQVFGLYGKWHGVVVEEKGARGTEKVLCDISINNVHVTDDSKLNGDGKLFDEDFTFQGTVGKDGSLNMTFSDTVASKLANCTFKNVGGHLFYDPDRGVWTYRGNVTENTEETFILEPVDPTGSTMQRSMGTPKYKPGPDDYEIRNDDIAWLALIVCGGLLFLLLFGFLLGKAIAG